MRHTRCMDDDEVAAVLAEALAGRRLSRRAARELAATLLRVAGALPPGTGNLAELSRRVNVAAEILDARAGDRLDCASSRRRTSPDSMTDRLRDDAPAPGPRTRELAASHQTDCSQLIHDQG